jgi:hypothetical protein
MNTIESVGVVTLLASALLLRSAFAASNADLEKAMGYDGLQKISVADMRFSDAESLRDALDSKRAKATAKRRAA